MKLYGFPSEVKPNKIFHIFSDQDIKYLKYTGLSHHNVGSFYTYLFWKQRIRIFKCDFFTNQYPHILQAIMTA